MNKITIDPTIFKQGQVAFNRGKQKSENPFNTDPPQTYAINSDSWLAGWNNAAFEACKKEKNMLEFMGKLNPLQNLAVEWLDLADKFKDIEAKANYHYCMICAKKEFERFEIPLPQSLIQFEDIADQPSYIWQTRKDLE